MSKEDLMKAAVLSTVPKYRVLTFQSKSTVNEMLSLSKYYENEIGYKHNSRRCDEDIEKCKGKFPITVFHHPILDTKDISPRQLLTLLDICRMELCFPNLNSYYIVELMLDEMPAVSSANYTTSMTRVIPNINRKDILSVSRLDMVEFYIYNIIVEYKQDNAMFIEDKIYTRDDYEIDKNRLPGLDKYRNDAERFMFGWR